MPMIRMDVDQAETTINTMRSSMNDFQQQLSTLSNAVEALKGAWEGSAQVQFSNAWSEWNQRFQTAIHQLEPMISGLTQERQQIIDADSSSHFA